MAEKEYIEREALEKFVSGIRRNLPLESPDFITRDYMLLNFEQYIHLMPAADVAPVRHGRWVKEKRDVLIHWHCSACRDCYFLDVPNAKYCPHCGCKMDMDGGDGNE